MWLMKVWSATDSVFTPGRAASASRTWALWAESRISHVRSMTMRPRSESATSSPFTSAPVAATVSTIWTAVVVASSTSMR